MASYRARPSRADRAQAIVAVIAIHLALGALVLRGTDRFAATPQPPPTRLIDIALRPPPPPPPPPRQHQSAAQRAPGQAGKKALPSPIVAPPRILPVTPPLPAAPIAGSGSASSAGASAAGSGTGAGGEGNGLGGGGPGGGGIGADARLLSGGLDHHDYRRLRAFGTTAGRAVIGLLVGPDGRVAQCSIRQSSGDPGLDAELCAIVQPRMRWAPARDRAGRPLTVGIIYTAIWSRD